LKTLPDNTITVAAHARDRIYRNREPAKDPVAFSARQMSDAPKFWFRLPDEEQMLMKLTPAQFRCYHVVMREIQRSKNAGLISTRQVAERTGISLRHTHAALAALVMQGHLKNEKRPGAITKYSMPFTWYEKDSRSSTDEPSQKSGRSPTGKQSTSRPSTDGRLRPTIQTVPAGQPETPVDLPVGAPHRSPVGKQHCSPTGEQHLESSECSEPALSEFVVEEREHPADCGHASQRRRSGARSARNTPSNQTNGDRPEPLASSTEPTLEERPPSIPKPWTSRELAMVRRGVTTFLGWEPSKGFEKSVMLRVRGASADAVSAILDEKYRNRHCRPGERYAPRSENWFLEVLSNELNGQHFPEPPAAPQPVSEAQRQFNAAANEAIEIPGWEAKISRQTARADLKLETKEIETMARTLP
jgi:hypothetical protein